MDRRFVDHLVNQDLVTKQQMQRIILLASKDKKGLVSQLVDADLIDQERLALELVSFYNLERHEEVTTSSLDALALIPKEMAKRLGVLPLSIDKHTGQVNVVVFDPQISQRALIHLEDSTGCPPKVFVTSRDTFFEQLRASYAAEKEQAAVMPSKSKNSRQSKRASGNLARIQPRRIAVPRPKPEAPEKPASKVEVNAALDEFEQLLEDDDPAVSSPRASFAGRAQMLSMKEKDPKPQRDAAPAQDPWESNSTAVSSWSWDDFETEEEDQLSSEEKASAGERRKSKKRARSNDDSFSLFEISDVHSEELSMDERFEEQTRALHAMEDELKRQREVVQALADLLIDAGVVSRRNLARRIKELRRSKG